MPTFNFRCPGCQTTLKSSGPVEAGKHIKCPKCATVFQLAAAPPSGEAVQEGAGPGARGRSRPGEDYNEEPPRRRGSRRDEEDEDDERDDYEEDRPRPRKKRRKKAARSALVLWLVLGGVGLFVLIGSVVALVWFLGVFTQARIVGTWTLDHPIAKDAIRYEFRADGTFTQSVNWIARIQLNGTYTVSGDTLTLVPTDLQGVGKNVPVGQHQFRIESVGATELILLGPGQFGQPQRLVLKRVP